MINQCCIHDRLAHLSPSQYAVLEAAATLETFDLPALNALLDQPVAATLRDLIASGIVCLEAGEYSIEPLMRD